MGNIAQCPLAGCYESPDSAVSEGTLADPGRPGSSKPVPRTLITPEEGAAMEGALEAASPAMDTMALVMTKLQKRLSTARSRLQAQAQAAAEPGYCPDEKRLRQNIQNARQFSQLERSMSREEKIQAGIRLLEQRLAHHRMVQVVMKDDGNCQFRALSHQMYGTQEYYPEVRAAVVKHMAQQHAEYALFMEEPIDQYLGRMSADRSWGDELTLKAAVDCFGLKLHVVSSTEQKWHLVYTPTSKMIGANAAVDPIYQQARKLLFLAYISPVHFNSIMPKLDNAVQA